MPKKLKTRRSTKKFFHLFFNGEVAEPQYFEGFNNLPSNFRIKLHRIAKDKSEAPWQLIDRAIKVKSDLESKDEFNSKDGDEAWCIFDVDDYLKQSPKKFNEAIKKAEKNRIKLGWSNQCFEIWFLLHFEYCESVISRKDYDQKLRKYFKKECEGFIYQKNCDVFDELSGLQEKAIKNAEKLFKSHPNLQDNPSTKVFEIVKNLKELLLNNN